MERPVRHVLMFGHNRSHSCWFCKQLAAVQPQRVSQQFAEDPRQLRRFGELKEKWVVDMKPKRIAKFAGVLSRLPDKIPIGYVRTLAGNNAINLIRHGTDVRFRQDAVKDQVSILFETGGRFSYLVHRPHEAPADSSILKSWEGKVPAPGAVSNALDSCYNSSGKSN